MVPAFCRISKDCNESQEMFPMINPGIAKGRAHSQPNKCSPQTKWKIKKAGLI
jgi:hypothetical protein